jgi:hypothetical protein
LTYASTSPKRSIARSQMRRAAFDQAKTMQRVYAVSAEEREALVEGDSPPPEAASNMALHNCAIPTREAAS